MATFVQTTVTPPGIAGAPHLRVVIEDVTSLADVQFLISQFGECTNTDRVGACYNAGSQVLVMNAFVQP